MKAGTGEMLWAWWALAHQMVAQVKAGVVGLADGSDARQGLFASGSVARQLLHGSVARRLLHGMLGRGATV